MCVLEEEVAVMNVIEVCERVQDMIECTRCNVRSLSNDSWDVYSVQAETMISPIINKSA